MLGWLLRGIGGAAKGVGDAVTQVVRVRKGDEVQREAGRQASEEHVHDEQIAVLSQFAAEVATRKTATWWDAFVDGINRLPRPLFVLWVLSLFIWPWWDTRSFVAYMDAMSIVPETIWSIVLVLIGFYFGGRVLSQDIRKPAMTPAQKEKALEIIKEREQVILESRTPLVVEVAPTRKPPYPPWAELPSSRPPDALPVPTFPAPVVEPEPGKRLPEVDKMIEDILRTEGGFVNDPSDSGGATNLGITIAVLSAWRETACSVEDVRTLTKEEAADIYRTEYFLAPSIDTLPAGLQLHVMDCGVNCGPRTGIKMLQRALIKLGAVLREDGVVGPATRHACQQYPEADIHNALVDVRVRFYERLAADRPKDQKFLAGWKKRANSFRVP